MAYRSPKLLAFANGQPCANCGLSGTTVSAHTNSVALGKGTAIKAPDYYTAHLCQACHDLVDGRTGKWSRALRMEIWTRAYLRTVARWFESGVVVVK